MKTENDGAQKGGADVACSALLACCPFCGGTNLSENDFAISCVDCGSSGPDFNVSDCQAKAAWNTRAVLPGLTVLIASDVQQDKHVKHALAAGENVSQAIKRAVGERIKKWVDETLKALGEESKLSDAVERLIVDDEG